MLRLTETRLPEAKAVTIYNSLADVRVARLAEVTFSNGTVAYIGWHDLVALRRQFRHAFKTRQELPGMDSVYEDQVRAVFSWETFWRNASSDEYRWLEKRLPDRMISEIAEPKPNPPPSQH